MVTIDSAILLILNNDCLPQKTVTATGPILVTKVVVGTDPQAYNIGTSQAGKTPLSWENLKTLKGGKCNRETTKSPPTGLLLRFV